MAYVNNGQFRAKELEVTIDGVTTILQITDSFPWGGVTFDKLGTSSIPADQALARLPLIDGSTPNDKGYTARLAAFYAYAEDYLDLPEGSLSTYGYYNTELPWGYTSLCATGDTSFVINPVPEV